MRSNEKRGPRGPLFHTINKKAVQLVLSPDRVVLALPTAAVAVEPMPLVVLAAVWPGEAVSDPGVAEVPEAVLLCVALVLDPDEPTWPPAP